MKTNNNSLATLNHLPSPSGEGSGVRSDEVGVRSLHLARGFTVFFIPIIHTILLYGNENTHQSGFASFLTFIAEWPGAQLLMLIMGIHFSLSKNKTFKQVFMRSVLLLIIGYALNLLKFTIPQYTGLLPKEFITDIGGNSFPLITVGDILHFAALALPILYIIKKIPEYAAIAIIATFIICFISPSLWSLADSELQTMNSELSFPGSRLLTPVSRLFLAGPPKTYFPVFPWLVYPLSGLAIGYFLQKAGNKTYWVLLPAGFCLMVLGCWISKYEATTSFYRAGPWKTIQHLGFVCCWLTAWHFLARLFSKNILFEFLSWCNRNITLIYFIQWPLICWLMPVFGYHQCDILTSIMLAIEITTITFLTTYLISLRMN